MEMQLQLIDLGNHLLQYADELDDVMKGSYYDCLRYIMNRDEFSLGNVGFDSHLQNVAKALDSNKVAKKSKAQIRMEKLRIDIGHKYQKLLYQTLKRVLSKLNMKALDSEQERKFVDNYAAIAYFRIPEFRTRLLECLKNENDPEIKYWRGTEYQLGQQHNLIKNDDFVSLFDWQNNFYKTLNAHPKGQ